MLSQIHNEKTIVEQFVSESVYKEFRDVIEVISQIKD